MPPACRQGPLHDAAEVARAGVPTVMMFVQSLHGISHNKIEDTKEEHLVSWPWTAFDRLADQGNRVDLRRTGSGLGGNGGRVQRKSAKNAEGSPRKRDTRRGAAADGLSWYSRAARDIPATNPSRPCPCKKPVISCSQPINRLLAVTNLALQSEGGVSFRDSRYANTRLLPLTVSKLPNPFIIGSGPSRDESERHQQGVQGRVGRRDRQNRQPRLRARLSNVTPRYAKLYSSGSVQEVIGWENIELISDRKFDIWARGVQEVPRTSYPAGVS